MLRQALAGHPVLGGPVEVVGIARIGVVDLLGLRLGGEVRAVEIARSGRSAARCGSGTASRLLTRTGRASRRALADAVAAVRQLALLWRGKPPDTDPRGPGLSLRRRDLRRVGRVGRVGVGLGVALL